MEKEPVFIAFSTQKGGVGKSALTTVIASYMQYVKGKKVAIIDCDFPQNSICEMRQRDEEFILKDRFYKRMVSRQFKDGGKVYPVILSNLVDALSSVKELLEISSDDYDIIFFDMPRTMNSEGIIRTIRSMDYLIAPVSADRLVMESTLNFISSLNENLVSVGKSNIKGLYLLWSMVDGREKTELYDAYAKIIGELGLQTLKTRIPDTKRFRREISELHKPIFRSTVFPVDRTLIKGSQIDVLADEIEELIKQ